MKAEILPPSVEHGGQANVCPEVLFVGRQLLQGLGDAMESQLVAGLLVCVNEGVQFLRYCEYHMEVAHIQQVCFPCVNPAFLGERLAFGAVAIAAGVVGRLGIAALGASVQVPTKSCSPAI